MAALAAVAAMLVCGWSLAAQLDSGIGFPLEGALGRWQSWFAAASCAAVVAVLLLRGPAAPRRD